MARLRPLNIVLGLTDRFTNGLASAEGRLKKFGARTRAVGQGLTTGLSLPLVGAGVAATNFAVGFEDAMAKVIGLTDATRGEVEAMRRPLLSLAKETGKAPRVLAETFFFVRSAGLKGRDALEAVEASAKASAAGMGDAATIADSATSAVNAYGVENLGAARATDLLVESVRKGKVEASTLGPVLGRVIPLAANLGVEFEDVSASMAALTRVSGNAELAGTGLRGMFQSLLKPSTEARAALRHFDLSASGLRAQLREEGTISVLETLRETVGGNTAALGAIFPNMEGLVGLLSLLGQEGDTVRGIFREVAESTNSTQDAFDSTNTAGRKLRRAWAAVQVEAIRFGNILLPVVIPAVQELARWIGRAGEFFDSLSPTTQNLTLAFGGLLVIVGPLIVAIGAIAAAIGAIGVPVAAAIAGVAALGAAIYAWKPLRGFVANLFSAIVSIVSEKIQSIRDIVGAVAGFIQETLVGGLRDAIRSMTSILPDFVRSRLGLGEVSAEGAETPALAGRRAAAALGRAPAFSGAGGPAEPSQTRVGGRLDIRVDTETGQTRVTRLESESRDFALEVDTGLAMGTP